MYDFKKIEKEARKIWKKNNAEISKAVKDDTSKKIFSFLEGPPTANAPPGLHHLEVRTYKDIINKFKFMQGFSVPRKGGWDCHGLPVEVQVEKSLGLKDKKEVINYGVDKFVKKARQSVFSNIKEWEKSTKELDYWIDLDEPYVTLSNDYIESVWWSLKELYKKKFLYEGHKVVPFCPRCGTPLSSHEVALGYKDVKEESVYVAFQIKGKKDEYILAWTTTPWTLPGNVALAVGSNIDYVKIEIKDGSKLILARKRLDIIKSKYKILESFKGKDLKSVEYEPLYDIQQIQNEKTHKIVLGDFVTTEDGTGIVHIAVMYGEDDYNLGVKLGFPSVHIVGEDGKFLDIVPDFLKGRFVKDSEKDIIEDLRKRNLLFKTEKITHSYPFCWRCDSPLLYYAINSWFIKVSSVRDKMLKLNNQINWVPKHIKEGRFGKWLIGAKDWALSRSKFWGTPLPIWRCGCGEIKVIGSISELKENSVEKMTDKIDLHKPWIDNVKLKCKCGKKMKRVPDVIDCWYDSGSASFAQFHYPFENKKEFERRFPYDFIAEAIDQTRGWFYTLHVLSTIIFNKPAYKNVICAGHIVDEKGEKMSKSKGNVIVPKEIIDKVGVDAVRLQFCTSDTGNQKRFSYNLTKENVIPFLNILYNSNRYYNQLENKKLISKKIEDKWILSRLNSLISDVTSDLDNYSISNSYIKIQDFVVNDFSRIYIKLTREREDNKEIIREILEKVSLLLAPFAPYISEKIYSQFSKKSVHLSRWPKPDKKMVDKKLENDISNILEIIERGLAERDKARIGLRWPLQKAEIYYSKSFDKKLKKIIKQQLNVKEIFWKKTDDKIAKVILDTTQTKKLEIEGYTREILRKIQAERKKAGLVKKDEIVLFVNGDNLEFLKKINFKLISERVNATKYFVGPLGEKQKDKEYKYKSVFNIKNKKFVIGFNKIN